MTAKLKWLATLALAFAALTATAEKRMEVKVTGVSEEGRYGYALEGEGKATKLKKYTVNMTGVVVDRVGYGTATCKKPLASWGVMVK